MKVLHLVLKHKWYDMIASGEKPEEYREIKPYWEKRLLDYRKLKKYVEDNYSELRIKRMLFPYRPGIENACKSFPRGYTHIVFSRGYTPTTMMFEIKEITMRTGNPEWGAEPNKPYFVISLGNRITKQ